MVKTKGQNARGLSVVFRVFCATVVRPFPETAEETAQNCHVRDRDRALESQQKL